jgi:hypothetical protein
VDAQLSMGCLCRRLCEFGAAAANSAGCLFDSVLGERIYGQRSSANPVSDKTDETPGVRSGSKIVETCIECLDSV